MKITIVSRIYLPEPAAASFYLGTVADELAKRGHEVTVLTAAPPKGLTLGKRSERVKTFPVLRDSRGYVRGYIQYLSFDVPLAFRLLFTPRPDLVLVEPPPTTGAVTRVILGLRHIPYIYDAADVWSIAAVNATGSSLVLRALRWVEKFALRGSRHIVSVSDHVIHQIRSWGINTPATAVGRGADTTYFHYLQAKRRREFLYAGSYSSWHGAEVVIDAFAQFLSKHPDYALRFIGTGTEKEELRLRAEALGIANAVMFEDPLSPAALNRELSAATASIASLHPDRGYGFAFATKTYSSLAAGCPVVFSGPGPTHSFLRESPADVRAGISCDFDAQMLSQALEQIVAHDYTDEERQGIAKWAYEHHSLRAAAHRTADSLERLERI